jgi:ketosteroid isomerase-like protein
MRTRSLIPAAVLLIGCGLRHRQTGPEPARGPARDSLLIVDQTRGDSLAARGAVDGMLAMLASDVIFLRAGVPAVYGLENVRTLLASTDRAGEWTWQPLGGGVSYDLRSAYTFGVAARTTGAASPKSGIRLERYIAYWRRAPRGPWRIAAYAEVGSPGAGAIELPAAATTPPAVPAARGEKRADAAAQVRAADSSFADLADRMGVAFAFSNTVAPMGAVFGPARLVVGRDAVQEYYASQGTGTSLTWHPVYAAAAGSGDLGFTVGEYIATGRGPSGAAVQRFGKYLTIWQRQPDGTWKFVIDGGNPTRAPER